MELRERTVAELLELHGQTLTELRHRGVIRTANAPVGDYAEWLVAAATGGTLAHNSQKSWDVAAPEGKLQVKSRLVSDLQNRSQRQLSPFRTWDFDAAVLILFDESYGLRRASCVPAPVMESQGRWSNHVNGHIVFATDELLSRGLDWTARLQAVSTAHHPISTRETGNQA